jgi:hypothetical protein
VGNRFIASRNFKATVYREVTVGGRGTAGVTKLQKTRRVRVDLVEIGNLISETAEGLASENPRRPRNKGGLLRARKVGGRVTPRPTYAFRRERAGDRQYQSSFTNAIVTGKGSNTRVAVYNLAPSANKVERGTGAEGAKVPARKKPFHIPISVANAKRINAMNKSYTASQKRAKGWVSASKEYQAAASAQARYFRRDPEAKKRRQVSGKFDPLKLSGGVAGKRSSTKSRGGQIVDQRRGYSKRFTWKDRRGRMRDSRPFRIKRKGYMMRGENGKYYLGAKSTSKYNGYDILRRALREVAAKYM